MEQTQWFTLLLLYPLLLETLVKTVVFTGSMKSVIDENSDTHRNLMASLEFIKVATTKISSVYIAFNNRVILGMRTSKINAVDTPYIANENEFGIKVDHTPKRLFEGALLVLDDVFDDNIVVLNVFGLGSLSEGLIKKSEETSMNVPVVITGQPIFGGVNLRVYEGSWTEINRYKRHTSARHEQRVATVKLM